MPTFNGTKVITTMHGDPVKENDRPITVGAIACEGLIRADAEDKALSPGETVRRYVLAIKVSGAADTVDVSVEDAALIQRQVCKHFPIMFSGPVCMALETPSTTH